MNCRDFEGHWNEILDARSGSLPDLERELEVHASACESCGAISTGYQVLRQAVSAWGPPPRPSAESIERLRALTVLTAFRMPSRSWAHARRWGPLAAAAALLAFAWLGGLGRFGRPLPEPADPAVSQSLSPRPLEESLAAATEATIDLAREASAPAARIGLEVFDFEKSALPLASDKPENSVAWAVPTASGLLQEVGERVNAGVRPISGSARHAFGFLLGAPPEPDPRPVEASESL